MSPPPEQMRLRAAWASVSVAALLVVAKSGAALLTGSVVILASLVDSVADLAASSLTLFSVRAARRPPDADHRFGHGKAEALSSLVQAALIAGSAVVVVHEAWLSAREPEPLVATEIGLAVMVGSLLATGLLVLYQRRVVRQMRSLAIEGDLAHYATDLISGLAVIAALAIERWADAPWIDPAVGALIALYLTGTAWRVGRRAVDELMDRELPGEDRARIEALALGVDQVLGIHDLRTRGAGTGIFIELHLELDPQMRLCTSHSIAEEVTADIRREFAGAEILIHQDPSGLPEARLDDVVAASEGAQV